MHVLRSVRESKDALRRAETEWQTRALAQFIAFNIQNEEGRSQALDIATSLSMTEKKEEVDTSSVDTRTMEDIIQHGDVERALARNMKRKGPGIFGMQ